MIRNAMNALGRALGQYLSEEVKHFRPLTTSAPSLLKPTLQPGDVLLVEGNTRVSGAIKYLTQSTWSHAALYIGDVLSRNSDDPDPPSLVEVDMVGGVWAVPLSKYAAFHTRICRPVALTVEDAGWALALYGFALFWALVIGLLAHRWYRVTVIESGADYRVVRFQALRGAKKASR